MGRMFATLVLSFFGIFLINLVWALTNLYYFAVDGFHTLFVADTLVENVYFSVYLKWILLLDVSYWIYVLIFMTTRKNYKSDIDLHYLKNYKIEEPKITVVIPAFNEEKAIEKTIKDYKRQEYVNQVLIIDNKSTDNTVDIAEKCGAVIIKKERNLGYGHSTLMGLEEGLKTDSNIIVMTEADCTYEANDMKKFVQYLEHADLVTGTRRSQVLNEKGNQNSRLHNWGNYFLAKLIQFKFINLGHLGTELTDVGCGFLAVRKTALSKVIEKLKMHDTQKPVWSVGMRLYLLLQIIENDLRLIEIPVSFKKRTGQSKIGSLNKSTSIRIGLLFLWLILRY